MSRSSPEAVEHRAMPGHQARAIKPGPELGEQYEEDEPPFHADNIQSTNNSNYKIGHDRLRINYEPKHKTSILLSHQA